MQNQRLYEKMRHLLEGYDSTLKRRALPILCVAAVLGFCVYCILVCRPQKVDVTLLKGQPFAIEGTGEVITKQSELGCVTYDEERRTVETPQAGTGRLRVVEQGKATDYRFRVVEAVPQGKLIQAFNIGDTVEMEEQTGEFPVTWQSSDEKVASVDERGTLTCQTAGICHLTETLNDYLTYTYKIIVLTAPFSVEELTLYPGERQELPVFNENQPIEWVVDSDCVTVDENNVLQGEEPGTAAIFASFGGREYSAEVCVSPLPKVSKSMELYVGDSAELTVQNAIDQITYSIKPIDGQGAQVAKVNQTGIVTGLEPGVIRLVAAVRGKKTTCRLTVKLRPEEQFRTNNYGDFQPETSIAAQTLIGMCSHYNDVMMADEDPWYNENWKDDVPKKATFDEMTTAKVKGANCANPFNWALRDMGLLSVNVTNLYGDAKGRIHGYNSGNTSLKKQVDEVFDLVEYHGEKTLTDLIKENAVRPGDILFTNFHTFIYRGEKTVFGSANDGKVNKEGKYPIFISWVNEVKHSYDRKKPVTYLLRFKEDYVPQYYYNKEAELVENPLYTAINEQGYSYQPDQTKAAS